MRSEGDISVFEIRGLHSDSGRFEFALQNFYFIWHVHCTVINVANRYKKTNGDKKITDCSIKSYSVTVTHLNPVVVSFSILVLGTQNRRVVNCLAQEPGSVKYGTRFSITRRYSYTKFELLDLDSLSFFVQACQGSPIDF